MVNVLGSREGDEVLLRYTTAIDTKNWPLLATCFTRGCVFSAASTGLVLDGRDAIVDFMRPTHTYIDGSLHRLTNIRIDIADDGLSARSTSSLDVIVVHQAHRDGPTFQLIGTYYDRLERYNDAWLIAQRDFDSLWHAGNGTILGPTLT